MTILGAIAAVALVGSLLVWRFFVRDRRQEGDQAVSLKRLNDFYLAVSQTNQLVVRGYDKTRLFDEICRICVEHGQVLLAAVFVTDGQTATRVASAGPAGQVFAGLQMSFDIREGAYGRSVAATAMRDGIHAISHDYQREAPSALWRDMAKNAGVGSVAGFPIRKGGKPAGALLLYATETHYFEEQLVHLIDGLADNVSFALDNIEREEVRTQEQQAMAESLMNFRAAFQGSPISSAIVEATTDLILEANDKYCQRYGVKRHDLIGHTLAELGRGLLPEDSAAYLALLQRDGRAHDLEVRTELGDGKTATLLLNSEPIRYKGKSCLLTMTVDVTEVRRAAAAHQARAEAEAANQAKTKFLSRMSHELRTPLNAMLGFAQLLASDTHERWTATEREQLEHIHNAGWHLLALVNDVMDVSRIESGTFNIRTQNIALGPLLQEVSKLSEPLAAKAGVRLVEQTGNEDGLAVSADLVRLRQIFINLMSNAIKYNRAGGSVRMDTQAMEDRITVAIVDTGMGMTSKQLEHLYEPFNRLGRDRGGIEGTGLGLSLTRELVQLMGGQLEIESKIGQGTTARVSLPRVGAPDGTGAVSADSLLGSLEPAGTVLYIEDNDVNVLVVEQMLVRWSGIRLVHAPDGASGIEMVARLKPDLVLLDMHLPDMNGVEVLRELNCTSNFLNVVMLSASAVEADIAAAFAAGATDYWTKPLNFHFFLRGVADILARPARSRSGDLQ